MTNGGLFKELFAALLEQITDTMVSALSDNVECGYGDARTDRRFSMTCKHTGRPMDVHITLKIQAKYTD